MAGTTFGIIMIVIFVVAGLVSMEVIVMAAAKRPYFQNARADPNQLPVSGGVHQGDPRSVTPPDELIDPGQRAAEAERRDREEAEKRDREEAEKRDREEAGESAGDRARAAGGQTELAGRRG